MPNLKQELQDKMKLSFAKGGFLTTDADGTWEVDIETLYKWFLTHASTLSDSTLREVREEIANYQVDLCENSQEFHRWVMKLLTKNIEK